MQTSPDGRRVLTEREGRRLKAYRDTKGILTIGIGHTSAAGPPSVRGGMTITGEECDAILARDLAKYEAAVNKAIHVPLEQHEFDALVSFAFNVGEGALARSSIVRRLNAGDRVGAGVAFLLWNKPPEILSRRRGEQAQFLGRRYLARIASTRSAKKKAAARKTARRHKR